MKKQSILFLALGLVLGSVLTGYFACNTMMGPGFGGMMQGTGRNVNASVVDRRFIEQMIPHHEDAVAMAEMARDKSKHDEVKTLADSIIVSQTKEIEDMKRWYKGWYGQEVSAVSQDGTGFSGMMHSRTNLAALADATDFDEAFLSEMIGHHRMAIMMANMLRSSTNRSEMKTLAQNIITTQNNEIEDMQKWRVQWGYTSFGGGSSTMNMMSQ